QAVVDHRLAPHLAGGGAARFARLGRLDYALGYRVADALVLDQEGLEPRADYRLDQRFHLRVVQPALGLTLELRLVHADREYGRDAFQDVLALDLDSLLDMVVVGHEPPDGRPQRLAQAELMRAAIDRRDGVDERPHVLVGLLGPRQRQVAAEA